MYHILRMQDPLQNPKYKHKYVIEIDYWKWNSNGKSTINYTFQHKIITEIDKMHNNIIRWLINLEKNKKKFYSYFIRNTGCGKFSQIFKHIRNGLFFF